MPQNAILKRLPEWSRSTGQLFADGGWGATRHQSQPALVEQEVLEGCSGLQGGRPGPAILVLGPLGGGKRARRPAWSLPTTAGAKRKPCPRSIWFPPPRLKPAVCPWKQGPLGVGRQRHPTWLPSRWLGSSQCSQISEWPFQHPGAPGSVAEEASPGQRERERRGLLNPSTKAMEAPPAAPLHFATALRATQGRHEWLGAHQSVSKWAKSFGKSQEEGKQMPCGTSPNQPLLSHRNSKWQPGLCQGRQKGSGK